MLLKGLCPIKYTDKWMKFSATSLPEKEDLYGSLNMEDITDIDYRPAKKDREAFEIKKLR